MMLAFLGKVAWFTTKVAVKHVVVPIATTALIAVLMEKAAERVRPPNGHVKAGPAA